MSSKAQVREPLKMQFLRPQLCRRADRLFVDPAWYWEPKWDGERCLVIRDDAGHRLYTREGRGLTGQVPELGCLAELPPGTMVDGELVGPRGCERGAVAARLQMQREEVIQRHYLLRFVAFDCLYLEGRNLLSYPLKSRRVYLCNLSSWVDPERVVLCPHVQANGFAAATWAREGGFEGVVAKRRRGRYTPGARSRDWLKWKF